MQAYVCVQGRSPPAGVAWHLPLAGDRLQLCHHLRHHLVALSWPSPCWEQPWLCPPPAWCPWPLRWPSLQLPPLPWQLLPAAVVPAPSPGNSVVPMRQHIQLI